MAGSESLICLQMGGFPAAAISILPPLHPAPSALRLFLSLPPTGCHGCDGALQSTIRDREPAGSLVALRSDTWRQKKGRCQDITLPGSGDLSAGEHRQWGELEQGGSFLSACPFHCHSASAAAAAQDAQLVHAQRPMLRDG